MKLIVSPIPVRDISACWNEFKTASKVESEQVAEWIKHLSLLENLPACNKAVIGLGSTAVPDRFLYVTDESEVPGYESTVFAADCGAAFSYSNIQHDDILATYFSTKCGINLIVKKQLKPEDGAMSGCYARMTGLLQTPICPDIKMRVGYLLRQMHNRRYL